MNACGRSPIGWFGRLLIVVAIAGLSVLAYSYFDRPARQPTNDLSQDILPLEALGERPQVPILTRSAARMDGPVVTEASLRATEPAYSSRPSSRPPPSPEFKFLGKITEGDETLVLLYGGGGILTVRGIGPVDDDYVVDAFQDAYLVLRHVSLGESQIIQLMSSEPPVETGWSAENTPQD